MLVARRATLHVTAAARHAQAGLGARPLVAAGTRMTTAVIVTGTTIAATAVRGTGRAAQRTVIAT